MKVLCPYSPGRLRSETEESLDLYAPDAVKMDVGGDGGVHKNAADYNYGRLLSEWWSRGEAFVLIEHDIVLHDRVMSEFESCGESWCSFPYNTGDYGRMFSALGCVRYSAEALAATKQDAPFIAITPWYALDQIVARVLGRAGFKPHMHWPLVGHHHNQVSGDNDLDTRASEDYRKPSNPDSVKIKKQKIDPLKAIETVLSGLRFMDVGMDKLVNQRVFNPLSTSCPDCGGFELHTVECPRVGTASQEQNLLGQWPTLYKESE